jgi:hypothetical protein
MITGSSVDSSEYSHLDCEGLTREQSRVKSDLDQSQRLQRMYVAGDIASVGAVRRMRTRIRLLAQPESMRSIVGATQRERRFD